MRPVTYLDVLRTALAQGLPLGKALALLRASGASPVEAALAVQHVTGQDQGAAREAVAQSGAWSQPRASGLAQRERPSGIGQHGRSGHGASSVLPHLVRQSQAQGSGGPLGR